MSAFVDTNVVAYALDAAEPDKRARAATILATSPRPSTSPQVLRELYAVGRSKLGLSHESAARVVTELRPTTAVVEDVALVLAAVGAVRRWQLSIWDALIVEGARRAGCSVLLTEDLQHGMDFDGVVAENPFA
ncbi:MAG: PIN domain-containing protein [Acidimicrobiales bacterium]